MKKDGKNKTRLKRLEVFLEFLIFGIVMGVTEDIIAIVLATDAKITWGVFVVVVAVTIPFAMIGELIVDRPKFITKKIKWIAKTFKKEPR